MGLVLLACAGRQPFIPAEHVTGITPHGYLAAEYEIQDAEGYLADVKIWSRGTMRENLRGERETFAHVAFEIDNQTQHPLQLPARQIHLESATIDDGGIGPLKPAFLDGKTKVPARAQRTIQVWFVLPEDVSPSDVRAFRVAWMLTNDKSSYSQRTPFLQAEYRYYYSPYYDPFIYDPFLYHGGMIIHRQPFYHLHRPPLRYYVPPRR